MIDEDLRRLERRAQETLSPTDQAAWLRARVRARELDASRLELAACLGSEAAAIASGKKAPKPATDWRTLRSWGKRLSSFGPEVALRAGLADAERNLRIVQEAAVLLKPGKLKNHLEILTRVAVSRIDALTAWVLLPSASAQKELAVLDEDGALSVRSVSTRELPPGLPIEGIATASSLVLRITWILSRSVVDGRVFVVGDWWYTRGTPSPVAQISSAIRRDLLPWALGLEDPLAKRAETVLDRIEIASPCHEDWGKMASNEDGRSRFCGSCQHAVFDLSAMSREEALELLRKREGERACVRLYRREDGRVMTRDCIPGQRERAGAFPDEVVTGLFV